MRLRIQVAASGAEIPKYFQNKLNLTHILAPLLLFDHLDRMN